MVLQQSQLHKIFRRPPRYQQPCNSADTNGEFATHRAIAVTASTHIVHWSEPGTAREAVYTNLDPASYRFRVMASNSAGLWNGQESTIQFEIEPLFWQT